LLNTILEINMMTEDAYPFNDQFKRRILALLLKSKKFMVSHGKYVKPEYFSDVIRADICEGIINYYRAYKVLPAASVLIEYMNDDLKRRKKDKVDYEKELLIISRLKVNKYEDSIKDKIKSWAIESRLKYSVMGCINIQTGQMDIERFRKEVTGIFSSSNDEDADKFYFYYDNLSERLKYFNSIQEDGGYPLGIHHVDSCLDLGGVSEEDLVVILGSTNKGKSFVMQHIAKQMMKRGRQVAMFPLESGAMKNARRIDMQISRMSKLRCLNEPSIAKKRISLYQDITGGDLVIVPYPTKTMSIYDLRDSIEILRTVHNFYPDVIMIDSANIMRPSKHLKLDPRFGQAGIYEDLRQLGQETGIRIICSDQTNRAGVSKIKVGIEDIGEAYEKAQIATTIIAICQTPSEYRCISENEGYMRFFIAKNREEEAGKIILAKINYEHLGIYSLGVIRSQDENKPENIKLVDEYGNKLEFDYYSGSVK